MKRERRHAVADAARHLVDEVEQHVVDSWGDLMPHAAGWEESRRQGARHAVRTALDGTIGMMEHGDLDDRTWARSRDTVLVHGRLSLDEAGEVLRSVRVAGLELMLDRLQHTLDLDPEERWQLQSRADSFCDQLFHERPLPDPRALDSLLAELEQDGQDLR